MPCMSNTTKWPLILWGYLGPILTIWDPNKKFLVGPLYGPVGVQQKVLSIPYSNLSVIVLKSKSENKEIRHKSLEMHSTLCRCRVNNALHCLDSTMQSQHCIAKPKKMISPPTTASFAASQLLSWDICKPGEGKNISVCPSGSLWIFLAHRIRQATNWLVKIFWEKTANIFVWQSGLRDIFGRPYQARRTREKVDYKWQPTWHNMAVERQVCFKMLQNNDPGPPWNLIMLKSRTQT